MAKEVFIDVNFKQKSIDLLVACNGIIALYVDQGLRLTLWQLYYQLVARNIISNPSTKAMDLNGAG